MYSFFEKFPEIVRPDELKAIIVDYFKEWELPEVYEVEGQMAQAQLDLGAIMPFALYWLYKQALRIPSNPKLSWMQITRRLCECGKERHDSTVEGRICARG